MQISNQVTNEQPKQPLWFLALNNSTSLKKEENNEKN